MDKIKGRRIVLVGGAGFIGHHIALTLKKLGADVFVVDSLQINNLLSVTDSAFPETNKELYKKFLNSRLNLLNEAGVPIKIIDARDYHGLSKILSDIQPQVLIQLAAVAHADRSNKDPFSTFDHSLRTLENALDCSRKNIEHFIYFSSSMVYGHFKAGQVDEETLCQPLGIYGALKFAGEKIVIAYHQAFGLPYTIVRPSALYGQRCISRRVVQIFIENAARGNPITVNGDGSDRLDFTYIGDLVHGIVRVIESDKSKGEIFNLTYGESRPIKQIADVVMEQFPGVEINYVPKDKLTPDRGTLCIDKAKSLIDYCPNFPLERGLVEYIAWYKSMI